jgi:hypothetical protein
MPAKSVAQRRFMAMAEHGVIPAPEGMSKEEMHKFSSTKEKGLPAHVKKKGGSKFNTWHRIKKMGPGE